MTFSADGTSHKNINFNSRHTNLKAEDYIAGNGSRKQVTRSFGIMASVDGSSEESMKDWDSVLKVIADLFNRSPFGQRCGTLLRTVDMLVKLTGMMSDHCAKEKKDAAAMEVKKMEAVFQKLGEEEITDSTNKELLPHFLTAYKKTVQDIGGQER